ncbi:DUF1259 domain-containing protein [Planococcus sp. CPCC 101016]|uniref:DUF1259 domain-containing protein n=1 Tax=Planococcus sp. CPCC 101016 TaxID=2599617 RepID=UPI0011B7967F|nr:DUF1259 domain-containing protein [Planococcus sp. CPCC 101016]TWT06417.1 DUF1259 domain-containing protein [Planococcus sp. CPCC 101016]
MEQLEQLAEQVGMLMNSEVELQAGECLIKRKRNINISSRDKSFSCTLDHDISFKNLKDNGKAYNQAEIFLLPGELASFINALHRHPIPLPTNYQHRIDSNPDIICVYLSSEEAPENFAARLSAAFDAIEQKTLI